MSLLTPKLARRFAEVGCQEGVDDPLVLCRYAVVNAPAAWFMLEYNPRERMFFGWANLSGDPDDWELGDVSLDELEDMDFGAALKFLEKPPGIQLARFWVFRDENFSETRISLLPELPPCCAALHAKAARAYRQAREKPPTS